MQKIQTEIRQYPPPFNLAVWIEKKYRVPYATASLIAELAGIHQHNYDELEILPSNILNNIACETSIAPSPLDFGGRA